MMKRLVIPLTALIAAILLAAILMARIRKADHKESFLDKSTQTEMKVGEQRAFTLKGLGSAGYSWTWTMEGDKQAVELSIGASGTMPSTPAGGLPPNNTNIDEEVTIRARASGRVTIHFMQRRPWEKDKPPLNEFDLVVTVVK
jgi:predicted secreted protein